MECIMRRVSLIAVSVAMATMGMAGCSSKPSGVPGATSSTHGVASSTQGATSSAVGVTAKTIRLGVAYTDFAPVRALGININWGNFAHAYQALVNYRNAHGGINGRTIVPYIIGVNPVGPAGAATACTQLTQDDKVFAVMGPNQPDCYLKAHKPTINGTFAGTPVAGEAQNFSVTPPDNAFDPVQLAAFNKLGVFKGKTVGLYGEPSDASEIKVVKSSLAKFHVNVRETAINSAPTNDTVATDQQASSIAQRFQSDGVNFVVAVGNGSIWSTVMGRIQSAYNPPWIATSEQTLAATGQGTTKTNPKYLENVLAASSTAPAYAVWNEPSIQKCVSIVKDAYPNESIATPTPTSPGSNQTYMAVMSACANLALFSTIAEAAGKSLTEESFTNAGFGLRKVSLPGSVDPVSFATGQPYPLGPVYLVKFDATTNSLQYATKSSS
jgi:hypothetical protein